VWSFLKALAVVMPTILVLDYVWIGLVMKGFYNVEFGDLARRDAAGAFAPRWPAAIVVYLLLAGAIVLFVRPHLNPETSLLQAFGWGAALGLAIYGVYDFTNYALLENWSLRLTLVDLAWGAFVCGSAATALHLASNRSG